MIQVALFYSVILNATRRISKQDLQQVAARAGVDFVATVLSTGNLIFRDPADAAVLERRIEAATLQILGKGIAVFVRRSEDFRALVAANPFPAETAMNPRRVGVRVLRSPASQQSVDRISAKVRPNERFVVQDRALWLVTQDDLSKTPLLTAVSAPWVGQGTLRSASALLKIAAALPA